MVDIGSLPDYPVRAFLPEIAARLEKGTRLTVVGAPGSGKTTLVPLALLDAPWRKGRILVQEPRRVAAKGAALRMSALLGKRPGTTVGWRARGDSSTGPGTEIEVVTDGVLLRLLQEDPALERYSAVVFDEFHERSLNGDLAMLFARDLQRELRPELRLLALSATPDLDALRRVFGEHDAVDVPGTLFPVSVSHRVPSGRESLEREMARSLLHLMRETSDGGALVFLPGLAEIGRAKEALGDSLPGDVELLAMHGSLPIEEQSRAILPAPEGRRKVVLASSIAESSVTVEGISFVLDSGLERVSRYDEAKGLERLVTRRVSLDGAVQRAGRAGRTRPGLCVRFWDEREPLRKTREPEIARADLTRVALELARWGGWSIPASDWPEPPDPAKLERAKESLVRLGALDPEGRLTPLGKRMAELPAAPAQSAFLVRAADLGAGRAAARLAAVLEEGLPANARGCDCSEALSSWGSAVAAGALGARLRELADDLCRQLSLPARDSARLSVGALALLARPGSLARRRSSADGKYATALGVGCYLPEGDALRSREWIAALELGGAGADLRARIAAPVSPEDLDALPGELRERWLREERTVAWNAKRGCANAKARTFWGALPLAETPVPATPEEELEAWRADLLERGDEALPWTPAARSLVRRAAAAFRAQGDPWPDWSDGALARKIAEEALSVPREGDLANILRGALGHRLLRALDAEFPDRLALPSGSSWPVEYEEGRASLAAPLQAFFGMDEHPRIGNAPLRLVLLSPARRPIQTTEDLPGYWRGSYAETRKEMKGRYPKHNWPEDPWNAQEARKRRPSR